MANKSGVFDKVSGDYNKLTAIEFVDQNPIGKSSRSNPVTYIKAYDEIRSLYADLPLSRSRKYKPSHFSFNVEGGRCEVCEGEGKVTIEMQFMADIHLYVKLSRKKIQTGNSGCGIQRKNIADILEMTVDETIEFFSPSVRSSGNDQKIASKLKPLADTGLGYIRLGQSSSTLSGGEAQRIKLASFLGKGNSHEHSLFIFDEPTTGLHFHDIKNYWRHLICWSSRKHGVDYWTRGCDQMCRLGNWPGSWRWWCRGNLVFEGTPDELASL